MRHIEVERGTTATLDSLHIPVMGLCNELAGVDADNMGDQSSSPSSPSSVPLALPQV